MGWSLREWSLRDLRWRWRVRPHLGAPLVVHKTSQYLQEVGQLESKHRSLSKRSDHLARSRSPTCRCDISLEVKGHCYRELHLTF